ncbi:MAG: cytochrome c oxidase assembly protein [Tepidisphaeraceae bacterium]
MCGLTLNLAHGDVPHGPASMWTRWDTEPIATITLLLGGAIYLCGLIALWRRAGVGHGIKRWEFACAVSGWIALAVALVSPIHPLGQVLFSVHMTQHEILMLVAAPLLVLGRPMLPVLHALPTRASQGLARWTNTPSIAWGWRTLANPYVAWVVHFVALWAWHIPALFIATLTSEWIHALQHASFLGSALLFWWAVIHTRRRAEAYGMAILYMFSTAMHSGLLGALLTFASRPLYQPYSHTAPSWGITALEDQQLGGLIMWIPAGFVYVLAGLLCVVGWLKQAERLARRQELPGKRDAIDAGECPTSV